MKTNDPYELVKYIVTNWGLLTGLPRRAMHEEGHFPEVVWKLCDQNNIDAIDFQDAWTAYWG